VCGIAGAFSFGLHAPSPDPAIISGLNLLQRRRGPDGEGLWSSKDGQIVFGHRRLAVIDTGPAGMQPMADATGRWTITFNGEIYNYQILRRELERLGCVLRTNSDTEVLINVIARWGEEGLRKLRGMYAFALWDDRERELWLVRDPYGIKPLYLTERDGILWFASQARALAKVVPGEVRREAAALAGFYLWGHVPEPFTWWAGIRSLPAGHVQRLRAGVPLSPARPFAKIEHAYVNRPPRPLERGELRSLVLESVRQHLVADVPVGVFLSAGTDSNIIAALAAETGPKPQTITLAFDEYAGTEDDEAPLAEETARCLGTKHSTLRIGRSEFEDLFEDFMSSMDQPTIDGLNVYLVSYAAAKLGLKVALSGLGGDELFGGYPSFREIPELVRWGRRLTLLEPLGKLFQRTLRMFAFPGMPPKAPGLLSHASDLAKAYLLRRALYLEDELPQVLDESWVVEGLERLATGAALNTTLVPLREVDAPAHVQIAALESCWYMRNQLLRDTDWAGMAHGVELRVPLVDFALLESLGPTIASAFPPNKRDLAACSSQIPQTVRNRRKTGFTTPVRHWITAKGENPARGVRGWAARVHRRFRTEDWAHVRVPIDLAA
jgi:asparagine synthase (glutamine-hydrolysing)